MSLFDKAQHSFIPAFFKKIFGITVINRENEPKDLNSYIICANHSSNWDPIVLGVVSSKPIRYMAKEELFKIPLLNLLIRAFGAYPVKRNAADMTSIKNTISILEKGEIVGIYPQGHRAKRKDPAGITPKNGVAMFATKAKTGILPVSIISKGYKVKLFKKQIVVFGEFMPYPFDIEKNDEGNMSDYKKITEMVYSKILENYRKYDTLNKK